MKNEAIGIAINGREVKIAHLYHDKYRLVVDFLESALFTKDVDAELKKKNEQSPEIPLNNDEADIFAVKNPYETRAPIEKETAYRENIDVLYSLLAKFAAKKIKVAFNISPSRITYQDLDGAFDYQKNLFKGSLKKKIESWMQGFNASDNVSVITRSDGTLCHIGCETQQPPTLDILEQLNTFFKGNLFLSLMDSNEVSLVNLARICYDFRDPSAITAIVQIETEFSRIIFMKGDDLLSSSPIINESFNPDIINIVYSKIIYELDNSNIPEISNILLTGRASSAAAKAFFEKKFPNVTVGLIISQPVAENLSSQFSREELSNYAIPIALAWKAIDSKKENFIPTNLLPTQIIDRQKVLTLSLAGYFLLILLGISAFIMTWKITAKKIEISDLRRESISLQEQINNSQSTVNRVYEIEAEIARIKNRIILSDSLSAGSDKLLTFLEKLNQSVLKINSVWIEEINNTPNGILIKGMSLKRGDVPKISEELGGAKINKLTRSGSGSGRNFAFEMEVSWLSAPSKFTLPKTFELEKPPIGKKTAAIEPSSQNSKTSDWGTNTIVNQTVVAEAETGQNQEHTAANSNLKPEERHPQQDITTTQPNPGAKSPSPALPVDNKFASGTGTKTENSSTPEALLKEEKLGQAKAEARLNHNSHFTIKINAHANKFSAQKEADSYHARGFNAYVTKLPDSNRLIPFWVCLGEFATYDEAQRELDQLNRAIPGKRAVVELSANREINHSPSSLLRQTEPEIAQEHRQLIKTANHTISSAQHEELNKTQDLGYSEAGKFTIRISAHVTKFTANKEVQLYRSRGYEAYITRLPNSIADIPYSVCLGNFNNYAEAENKIKELGKVIARRYDIIRLNK